MSGQRTLKYYHTRAGKVEDLALISERVKKKIWNFSTTEGRDSTIGPGTDPISGKF